MLATVLLLVATQDSPVNDAKSFLAALTPELRKAATMPFDDDNRTLFQFVPMERKGAHVRDLGKEARANADRLLGTHLSAGGVKQIETIRKLEDVLFSIDHNPTRDKTLYAFTFFGTPSKEGIWGWRYEGHHLSLNYTYKDGAMVSSSPQFLGAAPADVREGPLKGTRALAAESDLAFGLLNSLSADQESKAIVSDRVLRVTRPDASGFETRNDRVAKIEGNAGLPFVRMTDAQKAALKKLVRAHADVQNDAEVKRRLRRIEKAGWDEVAFAWMGGIKPGQNHYYRIQGPTFVIEFDNSQEGANHIHSVWREFKGDFGRDVLAEHYANSPHHRH